MLNKKVFLKLIGAAAAATLFAFGVSHLSFGKDILQKTQQGPGNMDVVNPMHAIPTPSPTPKPKVKKITVPPKESSSGY
jgi:hypothetical protein